MKKYSLDLNEEQVKFLIDVLCDDYSRMMLKLDKYQLLKLQKLSLYNDLKHKFDLCDEILNVLDFCSID